MQHADQVAYLERMLRMVRTNTRDDGPGLSYTAVDAYFDPERYRREVALMFRKQPVIVAFSGQLRRPGDFVTHDQTGQPILVARGTDGVLRAFLNVCRHRGMKLEEGEGCKRAFACPYHAWTYGLDGALRHIPGEDGFPGLDKAGHGLVPVAAVQERNGIVFVTQDEPLSDGPLGDLPEVLTDDYVLFNKIEFDDRANWKVLGETSMEGYHIKALHNQSFYPYGYDNLNVVELHGRNSRIVFPFRRIEKLRNLPREEWSTQGRITDVHQLFPNTHVSVLSSHAILIILEPVSPSETHWVVYQLAPRFKNGKPLDIEQARKDANFVQESGILEDRHAAREIQAGLASGANTHFTFGHYEQAIGHFHRHLTEHVEMLRARRT